MRNIIYQIMTLTSCLVYACVAAGQPNPAADDKNITKDQIKTLIAENKTEELKEWIEAVDFDVLKDQYFKDAFFKNDMDTCRTLLENASKKKRDGLLFTLFVHDKILLNAKTIEQVKFLQEIGALKQYNQWSGTAVLAFRMLKQPADSESRKIAEELIKIIIENNDPLRKSRLFIYVLQSGNLEMVKILQENGYDLVNFRTSYVGLTPEPQTSALHLTQSKEVAAYLIELGMNPNVKNKHKQTPLYLIAKSALLPQKDPNAGFFTKLVGDDYKDISDEQRRKIFDYIKFLIDAGADVNAADYKGITPLTATRDLELIDLLLEHGGNKYQLLNARNLNNNEIQILKKHGISAENLDKNCLLKLEQNFGYGKSKYNSRFSNYMQLGADPTVRAADQSSPLHYAAKAGMYNYISTLIKSGADPEWKDNQGRTAMHFRIFKQIMPHIDNLNQKDQYDRTPLHYMAARPWQPSMRIPPEKSFNVPDAYNKYLMNFARIAKEHPDVKMDLNAVDNMGRTPLHYAVLRANVGYIKQLLSLGANPDILDKAGLSPSIMAADSKIESVISAFKEHNINIPEDIPHDSAMDDEIRDFYSDLYRCGNYGIEHAQKTDKPFLIEIRDFNNDGIWDFIVKKVYARERIGYVHELYLGTENARFYRLTSLIAWDITITPAGKNKATVRTFYGRGRYAYYDYYTIDGREIKQTDHKETRVYY